VCMGARRDSGRPLRATAAITGSQKVICCRQCVVHWIRAPKLHAPTLPTRDERGWGAPLATRGQLTTRVLLVRAWPAFGAADAWGALQDSTVLGRPRGWVALHKCGCMRGTSACRVDGRAPHDASIAPTLRRPWPRKAVSGLDPGVGSPDDRWVRCASQERRKDGG
jgi:hypothetical protein